MCCGWRCDDTVLARHKFCFGLQSQIRIETTPNFVSKRVCAVSVQSRAVFRRFMRRRKTLRNCCCTLRYSVAARVPRPAFTLVYLAPILQRLVPPTCVCVRQRRHLFLEGETNHTTTVCPRSSVCVSLSCVSVFRLLSFFISLSLSLPSLRDIRCVSATLLSWLLRALCPSYDILRVVGVGRGEARGVASNRALPQKYSFRETHRSYSPLFM